MKALQFRKSLPRYALLKLLGAGCPRAYVARLAPLRLTELPEPALPAPSWVRIRPRLAGICGSDLATLGAKGSAYLAPVTSMPFTMGHEVVGTVVEVGAEAGGVRTGDRVVLHPALGCEVRGIAPRCDACSRGREALCRNVTKGGIAAGIQTGYCRDTGGGFSQGLVAHRSQVYPVPEGLDDRSAVLIEPFACALHAAFRVRVPASGTVLVLGCGTIGLLTIAALRATGCRARIVASARYEHQRAFAARLGADVLLRADRDTKTRYEALARALEAEVLEPELGKPTVIGGAAAVFDCVASARSIDDGLRFAAAAGDFVLVGMPGVPHGVDWTPMWFKELTVHAAYAYGTERCPDGCRRTFDVAIDLMASWGARLAPLVGAPFALADYRAAVAAALSAGRRGGVKTVFAPEG